MILGFHLAYWQVSVLRSVGVLAAVLLPAGTFVYLFLFKMVSFMQNRLGPMEAGPYGSMQLLAEVDLTEFADTITVDMPYGRKRALEIATTLAMEPELMLLDEPTQGMGHEDVHRVTELIKKVSAGRTILMVEHNMKVVSGICDKISVLQRGAMLAEGTYAEASTNPQVMEAYMGTEASVLEGAH